MYEIGEWAAGVAAGGSDSLWWAFRDSNPGLTGYEPATLTN